MTQKRTITFLHEAVSTAFHLYRECRYSEVGVQCAQILQRHPDQFEALYLNGLVAYRMGSHLAAERLIEQACRVRPEVTRFNHMTGYLRQIGNETWLSVREWRLSEFCRFSLTQGFIISHPKCGRTWLRAMLGRYLQHGREGNPLNVYKITRFDPALPAIQFDHDDRPDLKPYTDIYEDKSMYNDKAVVFLVRDPRDVLVSYYFHYTNRGFIAPEHYTGPRNSISDLIRHKIGGLFGLVRFYNIWARNRDVPERFHLVRYEDWHANNHGEFARLIRFFGLPDLGPDAMDDAISFASFNNMRRLEESNALNTVFLRQTREGDPEAFKVRRGVVGGYRDYLSDEDIAFIDDYLRTELDDFYADYKKPSRN